MLSHELSLFILWNLVRYLPIGQLRKILFVAHSGIKVTFLSTRTYIGDKENLNRNIFQKFVWLGCRFNVTLHPNFLDRAAFFFCKIVY